MRSFLTFVTRGRAHVVTACALCSVFSLVLFPFNYLSGALLGLATLRNGAAEGALVLLGSTVLGGAFMFAAIETARPAVFLALLSWAPLWAMAVVLRHTHSQGAALALAGLIVAVAVVVVRVVVGDPAVWWANVLEGFFAWIAASSDWGALIDRIAPLMTGIVAAGALLGLAVTLMLARWWHALLDRPGGFGEEFRGLRLPPMCGYAALVLAVVAWLAPGGLARLGFEWLMILLVLFGLQGIALAHYLVRRRNASAAWLAGLYVALAVMPQPAGAVALGLALAGLSDSWLDYRGRFDKGGNLPAGR